MKQKPMLVLYELETQEKKSVKWSILRSFAFIGLFSTRHMSCRQNSTCALVANHLHKGWEPML